MAGNSKPFIYDMTHFESTGKISIADTQQKIQIFWVGMHSIKWHRS